MKKSLIAALSCLALVVVFPSCDKHQWEDSDDGKVPGTKRLFEEHGGADHKGEDGKKKPH